MSDHSKLMEQAAWDHVREALRTAGVVDALTRDCRRPLLAKQLARSLQAFGFAVSRGLIHADDATRLVLASEDQTHRAQITGLEDLLEAMATPMHQRHPRLRTLPYLAEAQLPPGDNFFNAGSSIWVPLLRMIKALAPCYCEAQTKDKPRAHQHAMLRAA